MNFVDRITSFGLTALKSSKDFYQLINKSLMIVKPVFLEKPYVLVQLMPKNLLNTINTARFESNNSLDSVTAHLWEILLILLHYLQSSWLEN
ncbi:unnamed protein product [Heterobilharzia americana]|nr:unnamed protein product [Heterobilharzia americana]